MLLERVALETRFSCGKGEGLGTGTGRARGWVGCGSPHPVCQEGVHNAGLAVGV